MVSAAAACACTNADGRGPGAAARAARRAADSLTTRADLGRIDGSSSAKIWVVEISDFQCPYCKEWHDLTYPGIRDKFVKTGKIRLAYINFPLSQHRNALRAATAAMCASVQGKFWPMQDSLFTTQNLWGESGNPDATFEALAGKLGVNVPTWRSCLSSKSIHSLIEADMDRAKRAGVESTPSFIVGGRLIEGARPLDVMEKAINDALAK